MHELTEGGKFLAAKDQYLMLIYLKQVYSY